ncbi:hypothetical protein SCOR_03390 [Sulfidibacter corallicola]|uniref:Hpr(Ser) kinase/phosphatase n=1 Tax=Sulfidibacter corallicola TaxID=2818388 RepID=A0A8A4TEP2_SULCO|nr:hypothetical protein [Sulfidibacter corallicola]QTD48426.1 hypothetical protein J3U87_22835 [Sulfidibacter corallicola]
MKATDFYYHLFGLRLSAPFPCPELPPAQGDRTDVTVTWGALSHPWHRPSTELRFHAEPRRILLRHDGVGSMLVCDGNRIVIDPDPAADQRVIRLFLLGSGMGAILQQRRVLTLHASAVVCGSGAVLFLGSSGVGKSTTAAAFQKRGFAMLTDDLCAVHQTREGRAYLHPGFPQIKLWPDSVRALGLTGEKAYPLHARIPKVAFGLSGPFPNGPTPIHHLVALVSTETGPPVVDRLTTLERLRVLQKHTYRRAFISGPCATKNHLNACARLAKAAPMTLFIRKKRPFRPDATVQHIIDQLHLEPDTHRELETPSRSMPG